MVSPRSGLAAWTSDSWANLCVSVTIESFVVRSRTASESLPLPHDRLVRSRRRCLWALAALVGLHVLAVRYEFAIVQAGWSLTVGQGAIQGTFPLERPLPATYAIRNEVIARVSGLPMEPWFQITAGVVFLASIPIWSLAVYPAVRVAWCAYQLSFHPGIAACERCGYDLGAARTGVCPECGWRRDWLRAFRRGLLDRF